MWQYNQTPEPNELYHWGIKGMKWGQRRYQNKDGSLTAAGKKRYNIVEKTVARTVKMTTRPLSRVTSVANKVTRHVNAKVTRHLATVRNNSSLYIKNITAGILGGMVVGQARNIKNSSSGKTIVSNLLVGAGIGAVSGAATATKNVVKGN